MKTQNPIAPIIPTIMNPIKLLSEELKNKAIKKQSVQTISSIALVIDAKDVKNEVIPLLIKTFVQENTEMRVAIIKSMPKLIEFIGHPNNATVMV